MKLQLDFSMQPMLAGKAPAKPEFPYYVSPKYDGIRAVVSNGRLMSRKWLQIPNRFTQQRFGRPELELMDGELIYGEPTDKGVFLATQSAVMSQAGSKPTTFYVFDVVRPGVPYEQRYEDLLLWAKTNELEERFAIKIVQQRLIHSQEELDACEAEYLELGYEGAMLRKPAGDYKFGRSTTREGHLLKVKRFVDAEAEIIGVVELMHNLNEATIDEQGYTKRSHSQDGKVPGNTLGALKVRDLETGQEFFLGSGYTAAQRKALWDCRDRLSGEHVTYKKFPIGEKDLPRLPIFKAIRSKVDH